MRVTDDLEVVHAFDLCACHRNLPVVFRRQHAGHERIGGAGTRDDAEFKVDRTELRRDAFLVRAELQARFSRK
jgi:hypothetical protein